MVVARIQDADLAGYQVEDIKAVARAEELNEERLELEDIVHGLDFGTKQELLIIEVGPAQVSKSGRDFVKQLLGSEDR